MKEKDTPMGGPDQQALPAAALLAPHSSEAAVVLYEAAPAATRTRMLTELVGQVYESAPLAVRGLLLEKLLRPLGALGLVTVAGGIFAKIRFRSGWEDSPLRLEDVKSVSTPDVLALVDRVQQASTGAIYGLGKVIAASPVLASSAAASVLLVLLIRSGRGKRSEDFDA